MTLGSPPLITIITSALNPGPRIRVTHTSLQSQSFCNFQWLVADGGSTDGTTEWLASLDFAPLEWSSSADTGIYDAWNKALPAVAGEWVLFLGAGDHLPGPTTLQQVATHLSRTPAEVDLVYGNVLMMDPVTGREVELVSEEWSELVGRWRWRAPATPAHPGVFHRSSLFRAGMRFDTRFKIVGDSHFVIKCILEKAPRHIPVLVDIMPIDGVSNNWTHALKIAKEYSLIIDDLKLSPPILHAALDWLKITLKVVAKNALPRRAAVSILNGLLRIKGRPARWRA